MDQDNKRNSKLTAITPNPSEKKKSPDLSEKIVAPFLFVLRKARNPGLWRSLQKPTGSPPVENESLFSNKKWD